MGCASHIYQQFLVLVSLKKYEFDVAHFHIENLKHLFLLKLLTARSMTHCEPVLKLLQKRIKPSKWSLLQLLLKRPNWIRNYWVLVWSRALHTSDRMAYWLWLGKEQEAGDSRSVMQYIAIGIFCLAVGGHSRRLTSLDCALERNNREQILRLYS